jgi:hypothetical protein
MLPLLSIFVTRTVPERSIFSLTGAPSYVFHPGEFVARSFRVYIFA